MKNIWVISVAALALSGCDTKASSDDSLRESVAISLVPDVTDKQVYQPAADEVLRIYNCPKAPDGSYLFRLRPITDKRLTPIESVSLPDAVSMEKENKDQDPQFRNKSILSFYTAVRNKMASFYSQTDTIKTLDNSECFRTIAGELSFLAASNIKRCVLLVASDLLEKSDLWNFYSDMPSGPNELAEKITDTNLLPVSLNNVEVVFLFNPRDRKEDQHFMLLAEGYKIAFESRGAVVKIQASL